MALAFNVTAGPLAQIGIEIIDLPTAMHLVKRLWNWTQHAESLEEVLSASGAHLVSTSSFNLLEYRRLRKDKSHGLLAVFVQNGTIESTRCPKASTALPHDPGQACLRAITTAILCLYGAETAIAILKDLIPYALLQQDQEGVTLVFEGPSLASLEDWVRSVAAEEDCDNIRDELMREVTRKESELTGISVADILNMDLGQPSELPFVIGVLKWGLTPIARRRSPTYPSRSLRAWSMAAIMHRLGFSIHSATCIIHDDGSIGGSTIPADKIGDTGVYIDTRGVSETDLLVTSCAVAEDVQKPSPIITHIGGIPRLAFRHVSKRLHGISRSRLSCIWHDAFCAAWNGLYNRTSLSTNSEPVLRIRSVELRPALSGCYRRLMNVCREVPREHQTELDAVLAPTFLSEIQNPQEQEWEPGLIAECLRRGDCSVSAPGLRKKVLGNSYILKAITLGGVYGACSKSLILHDVHHDSDNLESVLDMEIGFDPELAQPPRFDEFREYTEALHTVCSSLHDCLGHETQYYVWPDLLSYLFLGLKPERRESLCFKHAGLLLISDFLVRPPLDLDAAFRYHILRGQLLNLPITTKGTIQIAKLNRFDVARTPATLEPLEVLKPCLKSQEAGRGISVSAEPCWEVDRQSIAFKFRLRGAPLISLQIAPWYVPESLIQQTCQCSQPAAELELPESAKSQWHHIHLQQLISAAPRKLQLPGSSALRRPTRYLIDASSSQAATVFVLGSIYAGHLPYLVWTCFDCAVKTMDIQAERSETEGQILVIPWGHALGCQSKEHQYKTTVSLQYILNNPHLGLAHRSSFT
jgi:hypothetical protein